MHPCSATSNRRGTSLSSPPARSPGLFHAPSSALCYCSAHVLRASHNRSPSLSLSFSPLTLIIHSPPWARKQAGWRGGCSAESRPYEQGRIIYSIAASAFDVEWQLGPYHYPPTLSKLEMSIELTLYSVQNITNTIDYVVLGRVRIFLFTNWLSTLTSAQHTRARDHGLFCGCTPPFPHLDDERQVRRTSGNEFPLTSTSFPTHDRLFD